MKKDYKEIIWVAFIAGFIFFVLSRTKISLELYCRVLPVLLGIPAIYFAFINNFKKDLENQLSELIKKPSENYSRDIRIDYRFFAFILFGITHKNWLETFVLLSNIQKRLEYDKSAAVRGLFWSSCVILAIVLSFL